MKLEKVKETDTWKLLANNPKFEEEFKSVIRRCKDYNALDKLDIEVLDKMIKLTYHSDIKNRDLDSQFKLFNSIEFLEDYNNLIINEASGRLETNYGYDFSNTSGGKLLTNYSCRVYDDDGVELSYQSYGDKYLFGNDEFVLLKDELQDVILGKYNPNLFEDVSKMSNYSKPNIIGKDARFLRQKRFKDNLGIIEVSKCSFDGNNIVNCKEEYYFNTSYGNVLRSPELIHIMRGFPFAIADDNHRLRVNADYQKLGLTDTNYQDIARERFLRELKENKENQNIKNQAILDKYDIMIKKLEKELGISDKRI